MTEASLTISHLRSALLALLLIACACEKRPAQGAGVDAGAPPATPDAATATAASAEDESPAPASSFTAASLASIRAGERPVGARVAMEALLLTDGIIHTSSAGDRKRYYVLAIDEESDYVKALGELLKDLMKVSDALERMPRDRKGRPDPEAHRQIAEQLLQLDKRRRELRPDLKSTVAVELQPIGIDRVAIEWNTLVEECTGPRCLLHIPALPPFPELKPLASNPCTLAMSAADKLQCLADAKERLATLKAQDPPRLEDALPTLPSVYEFDEPKVLSRYNALVRPYNAEVDRRQRAQAEMLPSHFDRLARVLIATRGQKVTIRGVVATLPELAARTYEKSHGAPPVALVRELRAGNETFVDTFYRKTQYCITSYPPDAELIVKGEKMGRTPRCLEDLAVGEPLDLRVERAGYPPVALEPTPVRASVSGSTEVECVFQKGGAEAARCQLLK